MILHGVTMFHPSDRLDVLFAKAALMPGVERLIRHLHRTGSRVGRTIAGQRMLKRGLLTVLKQQDKS